MPQDLPQMEIGYRNAAKTPEGSGVFLDDADELTAKQIFRELCAPGSYLRLKVSADTRCMLRLQSSTSWQVEIRNLDSGETRSCAVLSNIAIQFIEAAFRPEDFELFADNAQFEWQKTIIPPIGWTFRHPGCSQILPDGTIVMKAGGYTEGFGVWDGSVTVPPSAPNYRMWLWIVSSGRWSDPLVCLNDEDLERIAREFAESHGTEKGN